MSNKHIFLTLDGKFKKTDLGLFELDKSFCTRSAATIGLINKFIDFTIKQ